MSSFVKKINTTQQLYKKQNGVKTCYGNQQLYALSSGNQSLDAVIGGGFLIGSIVVLFEDSQSQYYSHFQKTYLADGVVNEHQCIIVDPESLRSKDWWHKFMPQVTKITNKEKEETKEVESKQPEAQATDLKVAWRYNDMAIDGVSSQMMNQTNKASQQFSYKFDNSRSMGTTMANSMSHQLNRDSLTHQLKFDSFAGSSNTLVDLWEQITEEIQNNLKTEDDDQIFRLLLPNFNQFLPQFYDSTQEKKKAETNMVRFLRNFKAMVRASNAVCMISVDPKLLSKHLEANLVALADSVYQLTSFKDNPEMKISDYDGTIKIVKQPRIHSLVQSYACDFDIYALKLKGKSGIIVEKIHLDPEDDRADQDENLMQKGASSSKKKGNSSSSGGQSTMGSTAALACNPTKQHKIDF